MQGYKCYGKIVSEAKVDELVIKDIFRESVDYLSGYKQRLTGSLLLAPRVGSARIRKIGRAEYLYLVKRSGEGFAGKYAGVIGGQRAAHGPYKRESEASAGDIHEEKTAD